ncbi:spore protease YyaC [Ammoniphilus resinae]|uniref:Sporulation protein YyaC n=1 Tax=Ammoniphilus resinae TaxID=861532 RepID=A0ABS4GK58_9BACL|nr:spore protease YyaC [Ammoniphilus resinae]MBP1930487.1 putative sporulation protein YyaC [Ammoniphilus resinae]
MTLLCQVSYKKEKAAYLLEKKIRERIDRQGSYSTLIVFCIGTDRCTGDSLGPLVGTYLSQGIGMNVQVWGTLKNPVHALNLRTALQNLQQLRSPLVIAVDACLGQKNDIGDIQLVDGPLKPGMGVKKVLPEVGHFHIKGIVNESGFLETMMLQNTRLFTVMQMSEVISQALKNALS